MQLWKDAHSLAGIEYPYTLGAIEFVGREREQVRIERGDIDGQRATGLHSIDMERYLPGTADAANFCYWLDGTHLVVGIHDGDEYGLIGDGTPDFVRVYATIAVNR